MASFIPRKVFPHHAFTRQSYFVGHHHAALQRMKQLLSNTDLIIECRDYRTPITSRNPLFEQHLGDRPRLIVYTKQDLGGDNGKTMRRNEAIIRKWDEPCHSLFVDVKSPSTVREVLQFATDHALANKSLVGLEMMVIGMPNVGKSSLLNALRNAGLGLKKAAITGNQPGVTRKISSHVKIVDGGDEFGGVYLKDTPGVFVPYVPDSESMLKLALCSNVPDDFIEPVTRADYLLYQMNLNDPTVYAFYSQPTNHIEDLLISYAFKTGNLKKGGSANLNSAAVRLVQRWRDGVFGKFMLDEVTENALEKRVAELDLMGGSLNQAKKEAREALMQKTSAKQTPQKTKQKKRN